MKLGIYIGSFNPPHIGHLDVVKYLLNNKYIDKVLIVPTSNYWNKNNLIDINDRINMLKTFENDKIIVDTVHNNYPYTYELMRALKHELDDELYLILGADNIIDFDKWKEYKELLQYKIIVVNRNNIDIKKYIKKYNSKNFIIVNDYNNLNVSSTLIRNNISKKYLTKEVFNYIKNNHLYEE